jgi:type III secretion protein Q
VTEAQIRPVALERLTRSQVRIAYYLAQWSPRLTLDLPNGPLAIRLALASGPMSHARERPICLSGEAGRLWLEPAQTHFQHWLQHWIGELDPEQLPPTLGAAARQAALAPLLDALETLLAARLEASPSTEASPVAESVLALWRLDVESATPIAHLGLDAAASIQLATRLEPQRRATTDSDTHAERWPDLPIALTPWLGATRLRVAEWRGLETGDLLLLPRQVEPQAIPLHLKHRRRTLATAHLAGQRIIIDSLVPATMSEQPLFDPDSDSAPAVIDPDELEIGVDFELGTLQIPLRELRAVQPGYCFELTELDRPRIRLVVGGRLIGHGELVMIEDHLGVRVTELFGTSSLA